MEQIGGDEVGGRETERLMEGESEGEEGGGWQRREGYGMEWTRLEHNWIGLDAWKGDR